jgi:hypothetical protein
MRMNNVDDVQAGRVFQLAGVHKQSFRGQLIEIHYAAFQLLI